MPALRSWEYLLKSASVLFIGDPAFLVGATYTVDDHPALT